MNEKSGGGGCGCLGTIQIVLIVLKLVGLLPTWTWAQVLIPLWISIGIVVLIVFIGAALRD